MPDLRIPLAEATGEPRLLLAFWQQLSLPQRTALKIFYGEPLSGEIRDPHGWSELDYWAAFQRHGRYDDIGRLSSVDPLPYEARRYPELWAIIGVRGGKSHICSFISAYEATCGGHETYLSQGRRGVVFQIAQDLRMARYSLHGIRSVLESMPFISGQGGDGVRRITADTTDSIELWNGMVVSCIPPTVRAIRGYDSPGAVMDEVGIWYNEKESANPDREIYSQVMSRQAQFPYAFLAGISSPWSKQGLLWEAFQRGTSGDRLVLHTTTAGFDNPLVEPTWLERRRDNDPRTFARECLAEFQDSLSAFLDPAQLDRCTDTGIMEREPRLGPQLRPGDEVPLYTAAMDPAFRHDAFAFTIVHTTADGAVVQDLVRQWSPTPGLTLNPAAIMEEIAAACRRYEISTLHSDQYQMEALSHLAFAHGLVIERVPFSAASKAAIYGSLRVRVQQGKIRLLDHPAQLHELRHLEQQLTDGGTVRIGAPRGSHDDLAAALALATHKATWMLPSLQPSLPPSEPTLFERGMQTLQARRSRSLEQMQELPAWLDS